MEQKIYKSGDVVWVMPSKRLGWWPGRVQNVDDLRQELKGDVTDKTIAVVKYLNEDNYQFVEDETIICAYGSDQKTEYISLGMKKYFEKKRLNETSSTFIKFPNDVRRAEELIGGNPNIVDEEQFQPKKPEPAQSKYKNIFVDPRVKEVKTKTPIKGATPRRPGRPTAKDTSPTIKVSHPRFQGQSDHEVRIRRQEKSPLTGSTGQGEYNCDSCAFQTTRLNVMVLHKKTHLNSSSGVNQQKAAQKRPSSPPKKAHNKRIKKNVEPDGDLFDQVKRNLEAKETGSKPSPPAKVTSKTSASPKTPKTPKSPRTPRASKSPATTATAKTAASKATETKTQFNPKKKWLKSLQKEANPEVKNKLMADWDEDDEEEKHQQVEATQTAESKDVPVESDSDHDHRPSKSDLLHQRSDDEDEDEMMESDPPNPKSPEESNLSDHEATTTEESLAGISAEIDKLNADLDATNHETRSSKINGESDSTNGLVAKEAEHSTMVVNGVKPPARESPTKCDEEIKQDIASLLAETSVPELPNISDIGKVVETVQINSVPSVSDGEDVEEKKLEFAVPERETAVDKNLDNTVAENGIANVVENGVETVNFNGNEETEVETTTAGSNILMQVEGGETYMVVWEPGSNIQEFLSCGGEGEDGGSGATQTLLIDPSSLQAGSDLENLFQMAVAATAAPPQQSEQSNPTTPSPFKGGRRSAKSSPAKGNKSKLTMAEELLKKHGDAVNRELMPNELAWAYTNPHLFVPAAVIESNDRKTLTLAAFDVDRPNNQRKYQRNRVIAAFHHELNLELLTFGRTKNKAAIGAKLDLNYDHAASFHELRQKENFMTLTVRQYLVSCNRSPVKLFSERYLTTSPVNEIQDLPEPWTDSESESESCISQEECSRRLKIVEMMLDQHILTDSCLEYLTEFVSMPSERLKLYESQSWNRLTLSATSGILENSRKLYSKLADFLSDNVERIRPLQEGKDHKRAFVLDFLLPEALIYGVQKTFTNVSLKEASRMVIYGLQGHDKFPN